MNIRSWARIPGPLTVALVTTATIALTAPLLAAPPDGGPDPQPSENAVPAYPPVAASEPIIGRIEIPRVGVSSVILEGVDYRTIRRAVGHFPETPLPSAPGNIALAAHRTTDFFGLRNIRLGDEITITSPDGAFRYMVVETWVVDPDEVWVLNASNERLLTLVTCYPFDFHGSAPQRFIVRARALPPAGTPATAASPGPAISVPSEGVRNSG